MVESHYVSLFNVTVHLMHLVMVILVISVWGKHTHSGSLMGVDLKVTVHQASIYTTWLWIDYQDVGYHKQDNTYHGLCYTSRGTLAGTRC